MKLVFYFSLLTLTALVLHNRNIHYRVQWFVPDHLQMHEWEMVHFQVVNRRQANDLSSEEIKLLTADQSEVASYENLVTRPSPKIEHLSKIGASVVRTFRTAVAEKKQPFVIVYLMESQRPAESGFFTGHKPSLTPEFDNLTINSINYTQAYSVSNVTRGAQEAVLCGYRGSSSLSAMRGRTEVNIKCLTDLLNEQTSMLWLHPGDGRFDNQKSFWIKHGIPEKNILALKDFPESSPRTGWGIGDRASIKPVLQRILQERGKSDQVFATYLSVTNHIPWDLPTDADPIEPNGKNWHSSYATTKYADAALGDFLGGIKKAGIWEQTIVFVLSDHGTNTIPQTNIYSKKKNLSGYLSSHILFSIGGGLVESVLATQPGNHINISKTTSQADIAPFLSLLLGADEHRYMADGLFVESSSIPVSVDLGREVFDPANDLIITPALLSHETTDPIQSNLTRIYFRAMLNYIDELGSGHDN